MQDILGKKKIAEKYSINFNKNLNLQSFSHILDKGLVNFFHKGAYSKYLGLLKNFFFPNKT